ncbi:Cytochrome c oxidase assembly protein COX15-like protein [Auxenochlorella protothecoides]|uniref:Cytochrome c oxidase assembly protein COX15-like protein n=1 Tax=Auxenochlorella protothecoides TaxID=3075 RepID=A0A087SDD0_AUXPR|nr:Cytochrome c oxidase assembly protein COX15-like protein [Auxenochlorella protothecoides]KFM23734.1 Cytochrome c oxidase assembly protein COX15-like protein [Auxenochlorella protothecoides]
MRGWTTLVPLLRDVVARARCAGSLHAAKLDIRAFTSLSHAAPLGAAPPAVTGLRQLAKAAGSAPGLASWAARGALAAAPSPPHLLHGLRWVASLAGPGPAAATPYGAAALTAGLSAAQRRWLALWLGGCSAWVAVLVVLGGVTRLTRSGLSMTDWKFGGERAPSGDAEWEAEFARYAASPEFRRVNSRMTLDEFKAIYWMEFAHRYWGRGLGLLFAGPALAFAVGRTVTTPLARRLALLFAMGGTQGLVGWWMVRSGLEDPADPHTVPRVSAYRLAAHLTSAFAIYATLVGLGLAALLNAVPVELGAAHQANALTLFTLALALLHALRPGPVVQRPGIEPGSAAMSFNWIWNFTPSPGWTVEETRTLRLLLMRYGIGRWVQILATGLLPGKLIQQLYGATQRLLGQQSLAAFTGLRIDLDRVRAENEGRTDAPRKSGLIIYDGPVLTREDKDRLQAEAQERYGLTPEQMAQAEAEVAALQDSMQGTAPAWRDCPLLAGDTSSCTQEELTGMLADLHSVLRRLRAQLSSAVARRHRATRTPTLDGGGRGDGAAPKERAARPVKRRAPVPAATRTAAADSDDDDDDFECPLEAEDVAALCGMGFSEVQAAEALAAAEGCLEAAIELLLG